MPFTMGDLFLNEAVAVAMAHERIGDWTQAQQEIQSEGRLVSASPVSLDPAAGEIVTRLRHFAMAVGMRLDRTVGDR